MESIMWTILTLAYRYYCWARLMEMRKQRPIGIA